MTSEKSKRAWCMVCGKRRPLRDMNHVPALGYTCKKRFKCELKKPLLEQAEEMRKDPKLKHLFMSEEERLFCRKIDYFREWLRHYNVNCRHTCEGVFANINDIIAELDRQFPPALERVGENSPSRNK